MQSTLRLAIVGLGLVGKRHADAVTLVPDVELVAVADPNESGQDAAVGMGIPCFETIDGMFKSVQLDGVILATPTLLHVEQAITCIENKCPVLVEKPIGASTKEALALVQMARARDIPLLVGHHRRHNPLIQKAKEALDSGLIGTIRAVQGTCWFYKPDHYFEAAPWRKRNGAGPISVNLVHDIDLIRYLCGEVTAVQAVAAPSVRGFENEDVASAILEFSNGVIGSISVSDSVVAPWSWEFTSRENSQYPPIPESCYLIGGSEGSLSLPDLRLWSHLERQQDWWTPLSSTTLTRAASDPLVNQIAHFKDVIMEKAIPLVSGEEGLRTLQVIETIQLSAKHRTRLDIRDLTASDVGAYRTAG